MEPIDRIEIRIDKLNDKIDDLRDDIVGIRSEISHFMSEVDDHIKQEEQTILELKSLALNAQSIIQMATDFKNQQIYKVQKDKEKEEYKEKLITIGKYGSFFAGTISCLYYISKLLGK